MKAIIKSAEFTKEFESKFGTLYQHKITFDDKVAWYSSKKKDQTEFVKGVEKEFTVEERTGNKGVYLIIKPITQNNMSGYAKNIKKEQSRYSGFSLSYAKDLAVAGKIETSQIFEFSERFFNHMVNLDKSLEK